MPKYEERIWLLNNRQAFPFYEFESAGITDPDPTYRIERPLGVDFCTFEYVVSGYGVIEFENKVIKVQPHDAYILPAHVPVTYYARQSDPWNKLWINIGGALPENLLLTYNLQGVTLFRNAPVEKYFRNILDIVKNNDCDAPVMLATALQDLITRLAAFQLRVGYHNADTPAMKMKNHCEKHWREKIRLADLGRLIDRSPGQALRIFTAEYNMTPGEWLQQYKFEFVKQYLLNTNCTLQTIAAMTGFKDEFYFANWFKKRSGISPGRYRKQVSGKR